MDAGLRVLCVVAQSELKEGLSFKVDRFIFLRFSESRNICLNTKVMPESRRLHPDVANLNCQKISKRKRMCCLDLSRLFLFCFLPVQEVNKVSKLLFLPVCIRVQLFEQPHKERKNWSDYDTLNPQIFILHDAFDI